MQGQVPVSSHKGHPHSPLPPAPGRKHPIQLLCKCAVNSACPKCTRLQHSSSSSLQSVCDCSCPTCGESVCRPGVAWPRLIASQGCSCPFFPGLQLHNSLALACLTARWAWIMIKFLNPMKNCTLLICRASFLTSLSPDR